MPTPTPAVKSGGLLIPVAPPTHTFAGRLRHALQQFDAKLKDNENLKIVAMFGTRPYAVEHINVRGSELVLIDGPSEETNRYQILCHVDSLQLMLMIEPKQPNEKRRRIGFVWEEAETTSTQEGAPAESAPAPEPEAVATAG